MAYKRQAETLREVQRRSKQLERSVTDIVSNEGIPIRGGQGIQVRYAEFHERATLQVDGVIPNEEQPETVLFVTYTDPDKPGHSNENKLHLKLGELYLFKTYYQGLRCVLVVGERQEAWLQYVLEVFKIFFDRVVFTWESNFKGNLIGALRCDLKNESFWHAESKRRRSIDLATDESLPPTSDLRWQFYEKVIPKYLGIDEPNLIDHPTLRKMAVAAKDTYERSGGTQGLFWKHLKNKDYKAIWQERSYFNPLEFTAEYLLEEKKLDHTRTPRIPTLLADFGIKEARSAEDFGLYSERRNSPVYIQCKASGGGEEQHGKAVMNRSKEQIARSLLYRCRKVDSDIVSVGDNFIWLTVLDGNWRIPQRYPLKYLHMLQIAGYERIFKATDLVGEPDLRPKKDCPLTNYLEQLKCKKVTQERIKSYF